MLLSIAVTELSAQALPQQWLRSYKAQGKNSDRISCLLTNQAGEVFAGGYAGNHHGAPDIFVIKKGPAGDTLWVYYYDAGSKNEDYLQDMCLDASGNLYLTGRSQLTTGVFDCITIKLNSAGIQQWATRYALGGASASYGNALAVDAAGNVYVAGYTDPASASTDWLVLKYSPSGQQQWVDVINGPFNADDEAADIVIAPNGNAVACGKVRSAAASGGTNIFVKQYSAAGAAVWTDTFSNPASASGADEARGMGFNTAGELIVGGSTANSTGSNRDMVAIKYAATGSQIWATVLTDPTASIDEYLLDVHIDSLGNAYFAGTDYLNGFVSKINNDGTYGWRKRWMGPRTNGFDVLNSVCTDANGNVYATGRGVYNGEDYYLNGGMTNQIIAKYSPSGDSLWTYRSADTLVPSMGFAITALGGKVYAGGFINDTAYVDESFYVQQLDTALVSTAEWNYSGTGDALTRGQVVRTDAQNNVYCAATIDRLYGEGWDVVVVKYDPLGNLLWDRYYSTPGWRNDTLTHMELDAAGNIYLAISSDSAKLESNYKLSVVKMNTQGDFLDTLWYLPAPSGSVVPVSMLVQPNGEIALTALSNLLGGLVMYVDPTFTLSWVARIDSTQFVVTRANAIARFPNGDLAVGGYNQNGPGTSAKGVVQRYTIAGNRLWSADVDSLNVYDEVKGIAVNTAGDLAVTGASGTTSFIAKMDGLNGQILWRQVYNPNTTNEYGVKVQFTGNGDVAWICRGWTGFVARYITLQYSDAGVQQWVNTYNPQASDREPVALLIDGSNRVVTAGWRIDQFSTNYNYVLLGYSSTGVQQFENIYANNTNGTSNPDFLRSLTMDSAGNFLVTGESAFEFYNDFLYKMVTIKFAPSAAAISEAYPSFGNVYAYPNPSSSGLFLLNDLSGAPSMVRLSVFDAQGKELASFPATQQQVDLSAYPSGIYLLRYWRSDGTGGVIKLLMQ